MYLLADHIISPLGRTTAETLRAVRDGLSLKRFATAEHFVDLCIEASEAAICGANIAPCDDDVVFMLCSTKGNDLDLYTPAEVIRNHFGNPNRSVVVSNACISGVAGQIAAKRLIDSGYYHKVMVIGCDLVTPFIESGFIALQALSFDPCLPFDKNRRGLNLGEAAAVMLYSADKPARPCWELVAGSIHNDANHITSPSRTGEGSYRCLKDVIEGTNAEDIAMVGLHGTGTLYNDEMESIAMHRAGLDNVPCGSLKGYFGHTLGAAGVLETITALHAIDEGWIPASKGYTEQGTSFALSVSNIVRTTDKRQFVKLMSGFGGCNAAIRLMKN